LIEVNRAAADEQVAFARFHKMDLAVLHAPVVSRGVVLLNTAACSGNNIPTVAPHRSHQASGWLRRRIVIRCRVATVISVLVFVRFI
jgi:hypothetical protein